MATDKTLTLGEKLVKIQTELKAPKNLYNSFGKYSYRNVEGIQEALKPLLAKYGCAVTLNDEIVEIGGRIYVKATARICEYPSEASLSVTAYAREADSKKGMDEAQITGATSSYARKYALNGLFLLDDTKDADTDEYHEQTQRTPAPKAPATLICEKCGVVIGSHGKASASKIAEESKKQFSLQLCYDCAHQEKVAREQQPMETIDGLPFPIED